MGTSAERRIGYFSTNASKRAASCGEKMVMVSDSLRLIASTPVPTLRPPYPSLPRAHLNCPIATVPASVNSSSPLLPSSRCQVTIAPSRRKSSQFSAVPDRNPFLAQLDCCLPIPVQPVRRGVAAEQGSQRNPKLSVNVQREITQNNPESTPPGRSPRYPWARTCRWVVFRFQPCRQWSRSG